jgi:hypothetical protein
MNFDKILSLLSDADLDMPLRQQIPIWLVVSEIYGDYLNCLKWANENRN